MYRTSCDSPLPREMKGWLASKPQFSNTCVEIKYHAHKLLAEGRESQALLASLGKGKLRSLASWQSCESCHYHYTCKNYLCLHLLANIILLNTKLPNIQLKQGLYHIKLCPPEPFRRIYSWIMLAARDLCTETNSPTTSVNIARTHLCHWTTFSCILMVNSSKDQ